MDFIKETAKKIKNATEKVYEGAKTSTKMAFTFLKIAFKKFWETPKNAFGGSPYLPPIVN